MPSADKSARKRRPTIRDVAEQAGVSIATVSRVINNRGTVDNRLVERVRAAIEEVNYIPNESGRVLRRRTSNMLGVVMPNLKDQFYVDLLDAFEEQVAAEGYQVLFCNSRESRDRERENLRIVLEQNVAGILFAPVATVPHAVTRIYERSNLPIVLVDRPSPECPLPWVGTDPDQAGKIFSDHLSELGSQNPLLLSARVEESPADERAQAFWKYWNAKGGAGTEVVIDYNSRTALEDVRSALDRYLQAHDAIVCTNGAVSLLAYRVLYKEMEISTEDKIFIGFDNPFWRDLSSPLPTVIDQQVAHLGEGAAKALVSWIGTEKKPNEADDHQEPRSCKYRAILRKGDTSPNLGTMHSKIGR